MKSLKDHQFITKWKSETNTHPRVTKSPARASYSLFTRWTEASISPSLIFSFISPIIPKSEHENYKLRYQIDHIGGFYFYYILNQHKVMSFTQSNDLIFFPTSIRSIIMISAELSSLRPSRVKTTHHGSRARRSNTSNWNENATCSL